MTTLNIHARWGTDLHTQLLNWYHQNQRHLPWRQTTDPYAIWISEIMLQQTQVDTVIPYYNRFLDALPTIYDLAEVNESKLLKLWEGLGYYSRAKNLKKAAQQLIAHNQNTLPNDYNALIQLPGIGPYTAGAILSIGYNLPFSAVDGNVVRVYSRLLELDVSFFNPSGKRYFQEIADRFVSQHNPRDYNQALMELGALICTPKLPRCNQCPVNTLCQASLHNTQESFPLSKPKLEKAIYYWDVMLYTFEDQVYMLAPNKEKLLGGLWHVPMYASQTQLNKALEGIEVCTLGTTKHVFTHQVWNMTVHQLSVPNPNIINALALDGQWIDKEKLKDLAISKAFQKVLHFVLV